MICAIFSVDRYSSIETAPMCKILEQSDNYSGRYFISKNWGIHKVSSWMQFGCLSSHWPLFACTFWCFTPVSNFKAIGQLVMEILHFKDLGDTAIVITNAIVLVLRECQISIPTYIWGYIYPPIKFISMYWELTMLCHFKVIADGHTHTRTHACTHARTHKCTHTRTHTCTHARTRTHTHTHTHTNTNTQTASIQ